ncbi:MAG: hypothetical protein ACI9OJ_000226 [Myxococcota bacterium]|jgi:hypothetical protein
MAGACTPSVEAEPCCTTHVSPGCEEAEVSAVVCDARPSCCDVTWDAACVVLASLTGSDCQTQSDGPCCEVHDEPGCADLAAEACVCATKPSCCSGKWDAACAELAKGCAGVCQPPAIPSQGSYCETHPGSECEDAQVTACACEFQPSCCTGDWALHCVAAAHFAARRVTWSVRPRASAESNTSRPAAISRKSRPASVNWTSSAAKTTGIPGAPTSLKRSAWATFAEMDSATRQANSAMPARPTVVAAMAAHARPKIPVLFA